MLNPYVNPGPDRDEVDNLAGQVVLQFGTDWCGYCREAEPLIIEALKSHPNIQQIKVEDGPGRRLGRSFKVKLWPTLIILKNGIEVSRLVRPNDVRVIEAELIKLR